VLDKKQTILVLHNPKSGSHHAIDLIRGLASGLIESGFQVESYDSLDTFQSRSTELETRGDLRAVIAAGGDGTAAAVATRISSEVPLWLCPLGTENLLARYLGMTTDLNMLIASIRQMKTRAMDAGLANGRLFLIMVGVGFDAEVVRLVHSRRTGHIHRSHYWIPIIKSMFSYRFPQLRIVAHSPLLSVSHSTDEASDRHEAAWYFLLNLPRYASGLAIAPSARGDDGFIDVCGFKRSGLFYGLRYLAKLWLGTHRDDPGFTHHLAAKFRIEARTPSDNARISYQLDGDWGGYLPLEIECIPGRLRFIEPAT
jgi:diacylglycerol kinase family enzyme